MTGEQLSYAAIGFAAATLFWVTIMAIGAMARDRERNRKEWDE